MTATNDSMINPTAGTGIVHTGTKRSLDQGLSGHWIEHPTLCCYPWREVLDAGSLDASAQVTGQTDTPTFVTAGPIIAGSGRAGSLISSGASSPIEIGLPSGAKLTITPTRIWKRRGIPNQLNTHTQIWIYYAISSHFSRLLGNTGRRFPNRRPAINGLLIRISMHSNHHSIRSHTSQIPLLVRIPGHIRFWNFHTGVLGWNSDSSNALRCFWPRSSGWYFWIPDLPRHS